MKAVPSLADIDVDFEFPSTSTTDDIPVQECYIASQLKELQISQDESTNLTKVLENDPTDTTNLIDETHQGESSAPINDDLTLVSDYQNVVTVECASADAGPSAPQIEPVVLPTLPQFHQQPKVKYPNLEQMQKEIASVSVPATKTRVKPFTIEQLNSLYSNPEIERAQSFEREFIHNELQANNNKHALFELLTKYSRCRHALRINQLDVQNIRKDLEKDTPNMWKREKKIIKYQATCGDGVIVHANENYE